MRSTFLAVLLCIAIVFMSYYGQGTSNAHSDHSAVATSSDAILELVSQSQAQTQLYERNTDILENISRSIDAIEDQRRVEAEAKMKSVLVSEEKPVEAPPIPEPKAEAKTKALACPHCPTDEVKAKTSSGIEVVEFTDEEIAEAVRDAQLRLAAESAVKSRYPAVSSSEGYGSAGSKVAGGGSSGGTAKTAYAASSSPGLGSQGSTASGSVARTPATPIRNAVQNVRESVSNYQPRWSNRDGQSRIAHVQNTHGLDTTGMTEAEILREQDAYHDTYGPGHPVRQSAPMANVNYGGPVRTQSGSGCPGGYVNSQGQFICPQRTSAPRYNARNSQPRWYFGKNLGL